MLIHRKKKLVLSVKSTVHGRWSIIVLLLLLQIGCANKGNHSHLQEYICPMHPTVLQDKPGTCPVCGMDLVLKGKSGDEVKITAELNYLLKPTNVSVIGSIKMITPSYKSARVNLETDGVITYDTRRITSIPIRMAGRIEKLMIKYNFQPIRKGEKILEIYSPELVTAQRDLLFLQKSDAENVQLIESAKEKLRLLGVSNQQIAQIVLSKKEMYSFPVYSSVSGYIMEESLLGTSAPSAPSPASGMNGGSSMNASLSPSLTSSEIQIREGMYVASGQTIFKIVNTEQVWAEFNIRQSGAREIKVKDSISLLFGSPQKIIYSTVRFVQPFYQEGESFAKVRVYLSNSKDQYQIGQLTKATIKTESKKTFWIPKSATLDLGIQKIVFTKRNGSFRPKSIDVGQAAGNWIEVMTGIEVQDSIAYDAQFLMDSEGFIKVKN
ncbi:MAG TPA: efflux RND transporter periplasmic adaptor subunit [Chryseolinea sp.]|nr:efflux RND transporter periplasmic adaptor subunit [Chryseolinea sp.]